MGGSSIAIKGIGKSFGSFPVLSDINLNVEAGEFLTLLGPSGCGKSTMLRMIAGFESPSVGSMDMNGERIDTKRPKERGLSMVFQNYALYPHMTVSENIAMPLMMRSMGFWERFPALGKFLPGARKKRTQIADRVKEIATTLEIEGLLARKPGQLSGGQRQRVALGRALAPAPGVFLMDEPLSNLDARLRIQMRTELTELHQRLGITFIYVTHDQVEAMTMSSRVAIIMDGQLVQIGAPSDVYLEPHDLRVAKFIGAHPINVIEAKQKSRISNLFLRGLPDALSSKAKHIAFRPEDATLTAHRTTDTICVTVQVAQVEDHGGDLLARLQSEADDAHTLLVRLPPENRGQVALGSQTMLCVPKAKIHCFDGEGKSCRIPDFPSASAQSGRKVKEQVS